MQWTDENVDQLKQLIEEKNSFKQIAGKMGLTRSTVAGKCNRLGLKSISGAKSGPKPFKEQIILKSDKMILKQIKKHTDQYGWGLEISEILEYTGFPFAVILHAIKRLVRSGHIRSCKSFVADHVFYNDARVRQIGA